MTEPTAFSLVLVPGAVDKAPGEWISVQSSRELYERQIAIERDKFGAAPAGGAG